MELYHYKYNTPLPTGECVIALGLFDGVHIAHRQLIERAREIARARKISFGIFSFSDCGSLKKNSTRIYTDEEKLAIFDILEADFVVLADFSSISGLSPEKFVSDVLIRDISAAACVAGFNFRFGKGAIGNADTLVRLMALAGKEAVICDEVTLDGETVSSSLIRSCITSGDVERAGALLGAPYSIFGEVTHGNSKGRSLGFPTVNTALSEGRTIPKLGVYISRVSIGSSCFKSITNVGICPTFDARDVHIETHILDFSGNLYGERLCVYLLKFLREEMRFESEDELRRQIAFDIQIALEK